MNKDVFAFSSYKRYLESVMGTPNTRRGVKTALARALACQPTYISQVLHGHANLSLEQAELASRFFGHAKEETLYFLLLVQRERAGTARLKEHFEEQLREILNRRLVLTSRLGAKQSLKPQDQSVYYSSWLYAAVHIALTIPGLRTRDALATHLGQTQRKITEVLDFLLSVGLATEVKGVYTTSSSHVRIGRDSHNILKHHANWRVQALESLDREELHDLHYSGVVSLSRADVVKVKNRLLEVIDEIQSVVKDSREEELTALSLDLFSLKRS